MTYEETIKMVLAELSEAERKFPGFPLDPLHALAVLGEEFGELTKAVLQQTYEPQKNPYDAVKKEAVQTAAMALRFLMYLENYHYQEAPQFIKTPIEKRTENEN
jgi:NTP pyrophosphatase (non-canonical NTP hydrolase)